MGRAGWDGMAWLGSGWADPMRPTGSGGQTRGTGWAWLGSGWLGRARDGWDGLGMAGLGMAGLGMG